MLSLSCEACLIKQGQASLKTVELQEDNSNCVYTAEFHRNHLMPKKEKTTA